MVKYVFSLFIEELSLRAKPSTVSSYSTLAKNHFLPKFEDQDIRAITETDMISHILSEKEKGLSSKTIYDIITLTNSFWLFAFEKGHIDKLIHLPVPRVSHQEIDTFSDSDKQKIQDYILNNMSPYGLAILLCLFTGIRLGEICSLKWGNIDLKEKYISIDSTIERIGNLEDSPKTKTMIIIDTPKSDKSIRQIPIPDVLLDLLTRLQCNDDCYVATGTASFMEPRLMQKKYKALLSSVPVRYKKFHVLRHTFSTDACKNGMNIKILSEILGHADIRTTLRFYVHTSMEQKQKEINLIYGAVSVL